MNTNTNNTKVIVPCRFSYLHCWEPDSVNGGDPKYSVSAIVPKSDTATVTAITAAIEQAKKDSVSKWGGKVPGNLKTPLRDGDIDRPEDEALSSIGSRTTTRQLSTKSCGRPCSSKSNGGTTTWSGTVCVRWGALRTVSHSQIACSAGFAGMCTGGAPGRA